ncbi:LysR family transcriptional regulator [Paraburkholderia bannensis]|uniref:LysR family transcriptional regulator n=1 Tax=Paraburkholderia bannensis TaxID=765414 RepID=UPI0038BB6436
MRIFVCAARSKNFTAAAVSLGISPAQVSRVINRLEEELKNRLFERTTRRSALTPEGARYLRNCIHILSCVDEAAETAQSWQLVGRLRIHVARAFPHNYAMQVVSDYTYRYPKVAVEVTIGSGMPDHFSDGYDVCLLTSTHRLPESSLARQHLGVLYSVLCASPEYILKRGSPADIEQLRAHDCVESISTHFPNDVWHLEGANKRPLLRLGDCQLQLNTANAMATALSGGAGIGPVPVSIAAQKFLVGDLVRVLPEYRLHPLNAYAVYAARRTSEPKIRKFVDCTLSLVPKYLCTDTHTVFSESTQSDALVAREEVRSSL